MITCDIAGIGAGPHGLSTAAHLRRIPGLDVKIFSEPMGFRRTQVPEGMFVSQFAALPEMVKYFPHAIRNRFRKRPLRPAGAKWLQDRKENSTVDGFPRLSAGFESSLPGLHIPGAPSAWTYGPLMYFVAGTEFAARTVARFFA